MHEFIHNDEKIVKVGEPIIFENKTEWIPVTERLPNQSRGKEKKMSKYIDVDETLKAMDTWDKFGVLPNGTVIPFRNCENADDYVPYVKYEDMVNCVKNTPTADVVSKEKYDELNDRYHRLLESANILADAVRDYERREDDS